MARMTATALAVTLVLMAAFACGAEARPGADAAVDGREGARRMDREQVFDYLTKNAWSEPERTSLVLGRDGQYQWTQYPPPPCGTPDFQLEGKWNFSWDQEAGCGMILTELGSAIAFYPDGEGGLFFHTGVLGAGEAIESGKDEIARTAAGLPDLAQPATLPPAFHAQLTESAWVKTNSFDLAQVPLQLRYKTNGRFAASYRDPKCDHGGFWSIFVAYVPAGGVAHDLTAVHDPHECEPHKDYPSRYVTGDRPVLKDDLLVFFSSSYYRDDRRGDDGKADDGDKAWPQWFTFDRYNGSVRTTGEFEGRFKADEPLTIHFTFENEDTNRRPKQLDRLQINYYADGEAHVLAEVDLGGVALAHGEKHRLDVTITPPEAQKPAALYLAVDYRDDVQEYAGYMQYGVDAE